jgi:hypothetical protein
MVAGLFLSVQLASAAAIEPVGKLSLSGGAEKEQGTDAGGRFTAELLGVVPLSQTFGFQGIGHYVAGRGSRFGLSAGPIFGWDSGKAGIFVNYQYRTLHDLNFVHIRPSAAFYLNQANINLWYSHPVSSPQRRGQSIEYAINQLQGTFNYFPASDWASWLRKDNVELILGAQVNTFAGAGKSKLDGTGVGPVFGFAFMPMQNLSLTLFRGTVDNRSRYKVESGIQFFFNKGNATLKELRRRYLEPGDGAPSQGGQVRKKIQSTAPPPPSTFFPG